MVGIRKGEVTLGVDYFPERKKPCLAVLIGNCETKLASFNNEESAKAFLKVLINFMNLSEEDFEEEFK